jgi:peptidyl-prolyl cis-trans isomerase SurA
MRSVYSKFVCAMFGLATILSAAVVLDRIAVLAGGHVIKLSDIDRDIRLTDFLNRAPLEFNSISRHAAAERLITQQIIRDEIVNGGYRRAPESQAVQLESDLRRDRFGGSEERFRQALHRYGLTEDELQKQLLWQITVLQFIDQRFRGGVVVTNEDARDFYDEHYAELQKQYPKNNSLEALEPKILTMLEEQAVNRAFNEWLDEARKSEKVEFKEQAFAGSGGTGSTRK